MRECLSVGGKERNETGRRSSAYVCWCVFAEREEEETLEEKQNKGIKLCGKICVRKEGVKSNK